MPTPKKSSPVKKKSAPAVAKAVVASAASKPRAPRAAPRRPAVKATVPREQRQHYVEVAAYYIAERRGFADGDPAADWMAAEAEIDRLLAEGRLNA